MQLTTIDWAVVALYFLFNIAVGFYYKSRAGKSVNEYFLSGRNVSWWLAGASMVATTFAADTPLVVTGLVAKNGVAAKWPSANFFLLCVSMGFFFSRVSPPAASASVGGLSQARYCGAP